MSPKAKRFIYFPTWLVATYLLFGLFSFASSQKPYPICSPVLERHGYTVWYDSRNRIPFCVYEKLTEASLTQKVSREEALFKKDKDIYEPHCSDLEDYQRSGFDRGHMCPARDCSWSKEALQESFLLSNVCPQAPLLNRGCWKKLEKLVRDLLVNSKTLHVFTGPLFLPESDSDGKRYVKYQVIGENDVAIPTHLFKVIIVEKSDGSIKEFAYVIPNKNPNQDQHLESFLSTVQEIEKRSGLVFPKEIRKKISK